MCTAVVGGSIQRAATRIRTASDQRTAAPMRSHRTTDRRETFRGAAFGCVSGVSVTFQNNRCGSIHIVPDHAKSAAVSKAASTDEREEKRREEKRREEKRRECSSRE
jgi:hypothetical protein